jgi:hypothetical protein
MIDKPIDTLEAIAVAVAAYEYNGNNHIKNTLIGESIWSNKDILRAQYQMDYYSINTENRPPMLNINIKHKERAQEIKDYTKKNLFKALAYESSTGNYPPYEVNMFQKLNQETVTYSDFGFIASAPYYYEKNSTRDKVNEIIKNSNSMHVGILQGKVTIDDFTILRCSESKKYPGYVVSGICEGNLFLFFTSLDLRDIKPLDVISITGRVKDHIIENEKYPTTKLHYVNVKKGEKTYEKRVVRTDGFSDMF